MAIVFSKGSEQRTTKSSDFENECELQEALANSPALLTGDDEQPLALVQKEVGLPNAGSLDILFVDSTGYPVAVEVKLKRNVQSRREVVAQAFDYTSDLSQMTSDELDELTEGNLETALRSFDASPDIKLFESRWRECGANLRAGKVRLVIAVDDAKEDLIRIVQYINDHSDLDVRLIAVQKYKYADGGLLFVPKTIVHGGMKEAPPSVAIPPEEIKPEFGAIIDAYNAIAPPERRTKGKGRLYRMISTREWIWGLHFEFVNTNEYVSVDLHLENEGLRPLASVLQSFVPVVAKEITNGKVFFDPMWSRSRGALRIAFDWKTPPQVVAEAMGRLIKLTYDDMNAAYHKLKATEKV